MVDTVTVYKKRTREDQSEHGNLIRKVISQEEAAKLLTSRKENKDVKSAKKNFL